MPIVDDRYVVAENLSEAWLDAVRLVRPVKGHKVVHLMVRILKPESEDAGIRAGAQELIDEWNVGKAERDRLYDVETTRNTLFPAAWARKRPKPEELVAYYRDRYTKDGLLGFRHNEKGTYFGRIVAYPREKGSPADQLSDTVRKLLQELDSTRGSKKSSRYEINIYNEPLDRNPMSFPCLAHLSVHLHQGRLEMQAVYRNEFLVGRAYGNFLGLAELQAYMASAASVAVGELMVTIGHAELDGHLRSVDQILARFPETSLD
jgi:thymidylate synthase